MSEKQSILNRLFKIRDELEEEHGLSFDDALFEAVNHAVDLASRWQWRGLIPAQEQPPFELPEDPSIECLEP